MAVVTSKDKQWLFPQNDDVLLPENKTLSRNVSNVFSPVGSSWSGLSSPLGSELGSTETESEEDDDEFMAELTRQMADYMLPEDDDKNAVKDCGPNKFEVSSEGQDTPIPQQDYQTSGDEQNQEIHVQPPVRYQVKKGLESAQRPERKKRNREAGVLGAPPLVNHGSGMKTVFLREPASKTKTSGTGVFLPRGASKPSEVRKKLGSSTVFIPTRVLNALQLHFQSVNNQCQSNGPASLKSYPPQYDITPAQARRHSQTQSHSANTTSDIGLPQEWTY